MLSHPTNIRHRQLPPLLVPHLVYHQRILLGVSKHLILFPATYTIQSIRYRSKQHAHRQMIIRTNHNPVGKDGNHDAKHELRGGNQTKNYIEEEWVVLSQVKAL